MNLRQSSLDSFDPRNKFSAEEATTRIIATHCLGKTTTHSKTEKCYLMIKNYKKFKLLNKTTIIFQINSKN